MVHNGDFWPLSFNAHVTTVDFLYIVLLFLFVSKQALDRTYPLLLIIVMYRAVWGVKKLNISNVSTL